MIRVVFIAIFACVAIGFLCVWEATAGGIVEIDVGLFTKDISATVEYDDQEEDFETSGVHPFGVFAGYRWSTFAVGGEFLFQRGQFEDDFSDTEFRMIRVGPQFRYIHPGMGNLLPYGGVGIDFVRTTLEPRDLDAASGTHINFGLLGGALYKITQTFALGGALRYDYYKPQQPIEYEESYYEGVFIDLVDTVEVNLTWSTLTLMFNAAFLF